MAIAVAVHATLSALYPHEGWTTSVGIGVGCAVCTAFCAARATRAHGILRARWLLLLVAFGLWITGFVALAYDQVVRNPDLSRALPFGVFFALRGLPWFVALIRTSDRHALPHHTWFDWAQSILFAAMAAFLLFPGILARESVVIAPLLSTVAITYHDLQNACLAAISLVAILLQPTASERRFAIALSTLLVSYACVAYAVNHYVILAFDPPPGSAIFITAQLPLLLFLAVATSSPTDGEHDGRIRLSGFRRTVLLWMPSLLTGGMLLMAFEIASTAFWWGLSLGLASLAVYALRSALTQAAYLRAHRELSGAKDSLEILAHRDPLTHLPNRRHFDRLLAAECDGKYSAGLGLALLFVDVDEFKAFNDSMGHQAGDECLQKVARLMVDSLHREGDVLARYGGEEFVALLPNIDAQGAVLVAERLRAVVEAANVAHPGGRLGRVTVSVGVSHAPSRSSGCTPAALVEQADAALYMAKAAGRNRVVVS